MEIFFSPKKISFNSFSVFADDVIIQLEKMSELSMRKKEKFLNMIFMFLMRYYFGVMKVFFSIFKIVEALLEEKKNYEILM